MVANMYWPHYGWEAVFKLTTMAVSTYTAMVLLLEVIPTLSTASDLVSSTEHSERWRRTMHECPLGVIHIDRSGRVIEANHFLSRLLGTTPDAIHGRSLEALIHPEDFSETKRLFEAGFEDPKVLSDALPFTNRYLHADGHWVSLKWSIDVEEYLRALAQQDVAIGFCTPA